MVHDCKNYDISLGHHHVDTPVNIVANLIAETMFPMHPFDVSAGDTAVINNRMLPIDDTLEGSDGHFAVGISPLNVIDIAIENNLIALPEFIFSDSASYGIYFVDGSRAISENRITDAVNSGIALFTFQDRGKTLDRFGLLNRVFKYGRHSKWLLGAFCRN